MLVRHCDICHGTPANEYELATGKTTTDPVECRTYLDTKRIDLCPHCAAEALAYVLRREAKQIWAEVQAQYYAFFIEQTSKNRLKERIQD